MILLRALPLCLITFLSAISCTSASREGLPSDSPFAETSIVRETWLPYGTAIGDVSPHSAVLWLRTEGLKAVQVEWATVEAWEKAASMASLKAPVMRTPVFVTGPDTDFTLSIPFEGLKPFTRYRYQILMDEASRSPGSSPGSLAALGEFTTLPDAERSVAVSFAWSGDLGGQERCRQGEAGYPIFDVISARHPDFFIFLGDVIYSDGICPSPPNAPGVDFVARTLPEYRAKHRYQHGAPALRRFLSTTPLYVIWDDHEVKDNFSGLFEGQMMEGRQAFREYWPVKIDATDPHRMYRTVRYGADLELFILDTRQYRSRNRDVDSANKTMLGPVQLTWLLSGLRSSTATWKAIVTSVPLSIPKPGPDINPGFDGWAGGPDGTGFEHERQVIVDTIVAHSMKNVVFLAADVHYVQANTYDPDRNGKADFSEFVVGPLSARPGRMTPPSPGLNPTNLINEGSYFNFGFVHVSSTTFEVSVIDDAGKTRFVHRLQAQ